MAIETTTEPTQGSAGAAGAPTNAPQTMTTAAPAQPNTTPAPSSQPTTAPANGAPRYTPRMASELPPDALSARIAHAKKKAEEETRAKLLAELNITDPAAFKAAREAETAKLKQYEEQEEERKRASLSENEKLQADLAKANAELEELRAKVKNLTEDQMQREQRTNLTGIAADYIDSEFLDEAIDFHFKRHMQTLMKTDPKAAKTVDARYVKRWFADLAKNKPKMAKVEVQSEPTETTEEQTQQAKPMVTKKPEVRRIVERRRLNNGAPPPRQPAPPSPNNGAPSSLLGGKDPRPGRPNSMTKAEVDAYAAKMGVKMPR